MIRQRSPVPMAAVFEPRWLDARQVSEALGMSVLTVRTDWKKHAGLVRAARKVGRMLRFDSRLIAEMQAAARVVGSAE